MQRPNDQDPIVLIFQLAYRRGLAIQQNQSAGTTTPLKHNAPHGEQGIGKDGENGNSRNFVPAKGNQNADTDSV